MFFKNKLANVLFDYGNTLVLDPFHIILKRHSDDFASIVNIDKHGVTASQPMDSWIQANNDANYPFISHFYQETIIENAVNLIDVPYDNSLFVISLASAFADSMIAMGVRLPNRAFTSERT